MKCRGETRFVEFASNSLVTGDDLRSLSAELQHAKIYGFRIDSPIGSLRNISPQPVECVWPTTFRNRVLSNLAQRLVPPRESYRQACNEPAQILTLATVQTMYTGTADNPCLCTHCIADCNNIGSVLLRLLPQLLPRGRASAP